MADTFDIDEFCRKYEVHQETVQYLRVRQEAGARPYQELGYEEGRKAGEAGAPVYAGVVELEGQEFELTVPSPYIESGTPITVYKPTACEKCAAPTILIYYHGGGNVVGSRKTHETVCKILARDTPCIVVNVEYRRAPEHTFPANNDDARTVVDWVVTNKTLVGGSSNSKLGVSGDSAGGRLAAVVCHERRKLLDFAVLIYPNVNMRFGNASVQEFKNGPLLSKAMIDWFITLYGITEANVDDPRATVLNSADFSNLPPTLMIVAELDALRDGCYAYQDELISAGTTVEVTTIYGVPHAFWHLPATFKEKCQEAYDVVFKFIRRFSK